MTKAGQGQTSPLRGLANRSSSGTGLRAHILAAVAVAFVEAPQDLLAAADSGGGEAARWVAAGPCEAAAACWREAAARDGEAGACKQAAVAYVWAEAAGLCEETAACGREAAARYGEAGAYEQAAVAYVWAEAAWLCEEAAACGREAAAPAAGRGRTRMRGPQPLRSRRWST